MPATSFYIMWLILGPNQEFFYVLLFSEELSPRLQLGQWVILPWGRWGAGRVGAEGGLCLVTAIARGF